MRKTVRLAAILICVGQVMAFAAASRPGSPTRQPRGGGRVPTPESVIGFRLGTDYKLATYANGDFAGVNLYTTISPTFKLQMTYVAIDENLLGKGAFGPFINGTNPNAADTNHVGPTVAHHVLRNMRQILLKVTVGSADDRQL